MAATLNFTWIANPPEEEVTGYRLSMDCGSPSCVIADINNPVVVSCTYTADLKGTHAFSSTAYRVEADGEVVESAQSDYAVYAPKKRPVTPPHLIFVK